CPTRRSSDLIWDDFCAWYLELIKPAYQSPIEQETLNTAKSFFEKILTLAHPFMPFLTEELWHDELFGRTDLADCIIVAPYPKTIPYKEDVIKEFEIVQQIISEVRSIRNSKGISPKVALPLSINTTTIEISKYEQSIVKLANISDFSLVQDKVAGAVSFLAGKTECFVELENNIDIEAEK